ncbi:hypothetical protein [Yimella sp. cx-51]|uniref:hypothetical protein n=1 Tax=Yimella sp. cx-51 TaxID=2770551 RepID=UPI00351C8482
MRTAEYADWFNHRRIHGEIDNMPPAEYEALYWATRALSEHNQNHTTPAGTGAN